MAPRAEGGLGPLWALGGVVLGTACQLQQVELWAAWAYAACGLGAGCLAVPGARRHRLLWLMAGALLGWGLTGARAVAYQGGALDPVWQARDVQVVGRVASLPQLDEQSERFEFVLESAQHQGRPLALPRRVQLSWWALSPERRVVAGERWAFTVRLRRPHGLFNQHGFDRELWWWERGLLAVAQVRDGPSGAAPKRLGMTPWHPIEWARQQWVQRIEHRVPSAREAGLLAALAVGDQNAIAADDWTLFRITGVAHLMSISGLHITGFAWLATALLGWGWRRAGRHWPALLLRWPAPGVANWGGLLLAVVYAGLAGWGVPAQRTVCMLAVAVALRASARQWPWPVAWLAVLGVVVVLDPWAMLQAGFWLSFVAVALLMLSPRPAMVHGVALWRRAPAALGRMVAEQSRLTLALAPLTLLLFGQASVVGLLANLLAIPWVTLVLTPLSLLGAVLPWAWDAAAWAAGVLLAALSPLAQWPMAQLVRPVVPWPMGAMAVFGAALAVMRWPMSWRVAGVLLALPALLWSPPRPAPGQFEVLALDVGQGSAVLVRTAGHSLLYDTGPRWGPTSNAGERVVVPALQARGEVPDMVVVSHRDSDHAGGSAAVAAAWPQARWRSSYDEDPARRCVAGQRWQWDGVSFEVLHPSAQDHEQARLSTNAMSCVLRVSAGGRAAWLSGDLDADREVRLALARPELRADLLLAPHHGSRTSSHPALLNVLQPSLAIVQSGHLNRFGHPAPVVLQRYQERGVRWVNTPDCGAARWRSDRPEAIDCDRVRLRRYWNAPGRGLVGGGGPALAMLEAGEPSP